MTFPQESDHFNSSSLPQESDRTLQVEQEVFQSPEQVVFITDVATDKDDLEALAAMKALDRKIQVKGVVTAVGWPQRRASFAQYALDQLEISNVPVIPGSAVGKTDADLKDYEEKQFSVAEKAGYQAERDQSSGELFNKILADAADHSLTFNLIASHSDLATFLENEQNQALFAQKVKKVMMMGGGTVAKDEITGQNQLFPDNSNNYTFDKAASAFVFKTLQELGVPIVAVSRLAAAQVAFEPAFYDQLVASSHEHPVAVLIRDSAKEGIEALWKRAIAPPGNPARKSLPDDRDRNWFLKTFCGGKEVSDQEGSDIWPHILQFLPYDLLATVAIVPEYFEKYFEPEILEVNGTNHQIVNRIKDPAGLKQLLQETLIQSFTNSAKQ
jgi:inosine-uridine nucleoside N-ribohydrolase